MWGKNKQDQYCSDTKNLRISEQTLLTLIGWEEVYFIGPFGNKLVSQQQAMARQSALCFLRGQVDKVQRPYSKHKSLFKRHCRREPENSWDFLNREDLYFYRRTKPDIPLTSRALSILVHEVDKYNNTVNNIKVMDKLREVGNQIKLADREGAIEALKLTRQDLIKALKTERILRENPSFNPESFTDNISAIQALQICDVAIGYGKSFQDTIEIAVEIQRQLRNFIL